MTEWISFKDRVPRYGQYVVIIHKRPDGTRVIDSGYWSKKDPIDESYIYWTAIPDFFVEEEAPHKREVPKDGRTYLCWTGDEGTCLIYWSSKHLKYLDLYLHEDGVIPLDSILRYMDEKGNWVEL